MDLTAERRKENKGIIGNRWREGSQISREEKEDEEEEGVMRKGVGSGWVDAKGGPT